MSIEPTVHTIAMIDSYPLVCRVWEPIVQPRGTILCLHGIQSHSGWYGASSERFANAGYRVVFVDRRGSGMNRQRRGDTPSWQMLIRDIESVVGYFHTPIPITLLAISWGAKLATLIMQYQYPWLANAILLTPAICTRMDYSFLQKVQIGLSMLTYRVEKKYPIPIPDADYFTHTRKWQEFIKHDADTLTECTARFLLATNKINIYLHTISPILIPTFLLLADDDRIVDNKQMYSYFKQHFISSKSHSKTYCKCAHTLEFDDPKLGFVDDIINWLNTL